jgi:hypothetical protein
MSRSQVNLWFVFWPVQILAVLGLIFTSPEWLYLFLGWIIFCGLGSAVVLHRVVSHRSIKLKKFLNKPLLFLGDHHGSWGLVFDIIKDKNIENCTIISVGDLGIGFKYKKESEISTPLLEDIERIKELLK